MAKKSRPKTPKTAEKSSRPRARCGLCGKTGRLIRTECCNQPICDDEHKYVLFSYARTSCSRNHGRYTLCALHFNEGHEGAWQTCDACRKNLETEMYVWYGTNEYNFEKLVDPPACEPTRCSRCSKVIRLGADGYSMRAGEYFCESCTGLALTESRRHA